MAAGGVKPKSPFHFIMTVANMVKTPNRPTVRCKSRKKQDFKETFLFLRLYSEENTHIPSRLLDTLFLNWGYIPKQGKVLDIVQLLDITTRVLFT